MSLDNRNTNFRNRSASLNSRGRSKSGGDRSKKSKSRLMNNVFDHRSSNTKSNYMVEAGSA